jgi:hypothetical protein
MLSREDLSSPMVLAYLSCIEYRYPLKANIMLNIQRLIEVLRAYERSTV